MKQKKKWTMQENGQNCSEMKKMWTKLFKNEKKVEKLFKYKKKVNKII